MISALTIVSPTEDHDNSPRTFDLVADDIPHYGYLGSRGRMVGLRNLSNIRMGHSVVMKGNFRLDMKSVDPLIGRLGLLGVAALTLFCVSCSSSSPVAVDSSTAEAGTSLSTSDRGVQGGRQQGFLTVDGRRRTYTLYTPTNYSPTDPLPLLITLHGAGGTGEEIADISGFDSVAEEEGFLAVYPDSLLAFWNDRRANDVSFIASLIDEISRIRAVDRDRVYVAGSSSGGILVGSLACERSDLFAGYAFVKSSLPLLTSGNCSVQSPGSVLVMHGTQDRLIPYEGGRGFLSVPAATQFWAEANRCGAQVSDNLPNTNVFDGTRVQETAYQNCDQYPVKLLTIVGGGHTWPGGQGEPRILGVTTKDINGSQEIWDFFDSP